MPEQYWVIMPSGELKLETIPRDQMLDRMYEIIGCDCVEQVHTIIPDVCIVIDESGKIKTPPQLFNPRASLLYNGWLRGRDPILGPAILVGLARIGPYDEFDWFPLEPRQFFRVMSAIGEYSDLI